MRVILQEQNEYMLYISGKLITTRRLNLLCPPRGLPTTPPSQDSGTVTGTESRDPYSPIMICEVNLDNGAELGVSSREMFEIAQGITHLHIRRPAPYTVPRFAKV